MTDEVVECTALCMVAQAEELERKEGGGEEAEMEKAVLREFGRCLEEIIHSAAAASSSPPLQPASDDETASIASPINMYRV